MQLVLSGSQACKTCSLHAPSWSASISQSTGRGDVFTPFLNDVFIEDLSVSCQVSMQGRLWQSACPSAASKWFGPVEEPVRPTGLSPLNALDGLKPTSGRIQVFSLLDRVTTVFAGNVLRSVAQLAKKLHFMSRDKWSIDALCCAEPADLKAQRVTQTLKLA